jgi:hypothetical protein
MCEQILCYSRANNLIYCAINKQIERRRSFESDDNEHGAFSGSSSSDERVLKKSQGHRSRADSTPRRRKLPDVETASQGNN